MAESIFQYDKTKDLGGRFDSDRMLEQVHASSILGPFLRIDSDDTTVYVVFSRALDVGEQATLAEIVSAHDDLSLHRARRNAEMSLACKSYVTAHYDAERQASLNALLTEAVIMSYPNRIAYIGQALAWVKTCIGYYYAKEDELDAADSHEAVDAVTWDFAGEHDASDPQITLRIASEMVN